jgi:hypothetical protein
MPTSNLYRPRSITAIRALPGVSKRGCAPSPVVRRLVAAGALAMTIQLIRKRS